MATEDGPVHSANMPKQLGPYSHAYRAGNLLFIAGQAGINPATGVAVGDTFEEQARQAFENLKTVVEAAGSSMSQVAKTTVFLGDASKFAAMNELYADYFPVNPPVRSTPVVQLPRGLLISIEAVATLPEGS
jgi:2-iminobutanoate/2-iminopropanoate deaminase